MVVVEINSRQKKERKKCYILKTVNGSVSSTALKNSVEFLFSHLQNKNKFVNFRIRRCGDCGNDRANS